MQTEVQREFTTPNLCWDADIYIKTGNAMVQEGGAVVANPEISSDLLMNSTDVIDTKR